MTVTTIDQGYDYELSGQSLKFLKFFEGTLIQEGTTNEEVIAVIIDRIRFQNKKFPCIENDAALSHLQGALHWLNQRTATRVAQGVEGQDVAHETPVHKTYCLVKTSRAYYGGPPPKTDLVTDTLAAAIALAEAWSNPIGYDVYEVSEKGTEALHPVWEYNKRNSYKDAVDQIDPLHDGVD